MSRTVVHQGEKYSKSPQRKSSRAPQEAKPTPFGKMDPKGNIYPVTPTKDGAENRRHNSKSSNLYTKVNTCKDHSKQATPSAKGRRSRSVPLDPKHEDFRPEGRDGCLNSSQESPARLQGFYSKHRSWSRRRDYQGRGRSEFRRRNGDHFSSQDRFRSHSRGGMDSMSPRDFPHYVNSNGYYAKHHQRNRSVNSYSQFGHPLYNQMYHRSDSRPHVFSQGRPKDRKNASFRYEEHVGRHGHPKNNEDLNKYSRDMKAYPYRSKSTYNSDRQNYFDDYRGQSNDRHLEYKESNVSRQHEMSNRYETERYHSKNSSSPTKQNNINASENVPGQPSRLECIVNEFSHDLRRELSAEMIKAEEFHIPMNFKLDFLTETESVSSSSKLNPKATEFQPVPKDETSAEVKDHVDSADANSSETKVDIVEDKTQLEDNARARAFQLDNTNHNARVVNLPNLNTYPANISHLNQLLFTQSITDQMIQLTNSPILQNSSGQMFLSPPPPVACQQSPNFQMYNPNGFHAIQPAHVPQVNSQQQPQFGPGLVAFPSQHSYNLAELYASPDSAIIYGSPNLSVPMTPVVATQISAQLGNQTISPLGIYNGQPLAFQGIPSNHNSPVISAMPSAPTQPVMTRMEMPRQAYSDPRTVNSQQVLQPPPVMNFQTYCLTTDNEYPAIRQNVKLPDHDLCKSSEEQKPTLIERVGETLKEVRDSLKKTSGKSRSLETWEEIIVKLMKASPSIYSESKSVGPLQDAIIMHLKEAREETRGTFTDFDIFTEIVDLTWPIVSLDIHSPTLNSSLAKIISKNIGPSKDPVKNARIHRSCRNFLKAWCGIALEEFKLNSSKNFKNVNENKNLVKVDKISDGKVRCEQSSSTEESDSVGSNLGCSNDVIASSEDEIPPFEEIAENSKDCKTRRESLRGVCVGNRISYFESNAKSDTTIVNERKK